MTGVHYKGRMGEGKILERI